MTIYVITSRHDANDIVEVTANAASADFWRKDWTVTEHPDATPEEMEQVEDITEWLMDNYSAGAHWVFETTPTAAHVIALRSHTPGEYRVALERQWRAMDDYAADIRAA